MHTMYNLLSVPFSQQSEQVNFISDLPFYFQKSDTSHFPKYLKEKMQNFGIPIFGHIQNLSGHSFE